jgi:hypothetical protein
MNRLCAGIIAGLSIVSSAVLASRPGLVNANGPEQRQISDPSRDQGLNLGFAEVSGAFLGDVSLVIQDRSGAEVVNTVVDGPWFFARLPAGTYTINAVFEDNVKQIKNVRLSQDMVTMMIVYWDLNVPPTQMMARNGDSAKAPARS